MTTACKPVVDMVYNLPRGKPTLTDRKRRAFTFKRRNLTANGSGITKVAESVFSWLRPILNVPYDCRFAGALEQTSSLPLVDECPVIVIAHGFPLWLTRLAMLNSGIRLFQS